MTIEALSWDTDFFGIRVGRCLLNDNDKWEPEKLAQWDLIYFFIEPVHISSNQRMKESNIPLVDEKATFVMGLSGLNAEDISVTGIHSYKKDNQLEDVIRIGIQSGIYSRFSVDKRIPRNKFDELYTTWMIRSIDREIAREVFVYKTERQEIAGVVTLGDKNRRADIGIIAVDERFRGLSIGKKLVNASIRNSVEAGYNKLQVVTQKDNSPACRFYEQCGFAQEHIINIYHYWNK